MNSRRPLFLTLAAALVVLQAITLLVWSVLVLVNVSTMSVTSAIFFLVYAAVLAGCAFGLVRLHSWSRSPIVLTQLLMLGLAWDAHDSNLAVSIVLGVVAVLTLLCVLNPASLDALSEDPPD